MAALSGDSAAASAPGPVPAPAPAPTRQLEPTPAPALYQGSGDGSGDLDVPTLVRLRDQLKEQLIEHNTAILAATLSFAGQENFLDHEIEENFSQSATQNLKRDLENAKVSLQNRTMALQRTQIVDALRNKLKQDDEDSRLILETMQRILLLSWTIIDYQQQVHQKEQQLIDIKTDRLSLTKYGGEKLQQIRTMKKRQKKKQAYVNVCETEKMLYKLEKERWITTIIQHVFQNIIIGSRINWAEDESLKAIVLQLEKNVVSL
ncbi:centromere protein H [Melospiza georgiana]|uniref:centromere protein H n=1 Tax=Melospiza georgiana TaxID=44398 RepID=UPI0025AC2CD1|nr:centromere protein H [Melospiza georgiana]